MTAESDAAEFFNGAAGARALVQAWLASPTDPDLWRDTALPLIRSTWPSDDVTESLTEALAYTANLAGTLAGFWWNACAKLTGEAAPATAADGARQALILLALVDEFGQP